MGTLGAGVVSLVLAAIFVNTPVLLIAVMGLAATATLAVSLIDRTPRSYGFLLFGVTMMLVAVPEINSPGNMFGTAVARVRSEEHTSELQSLMRISYAVFCLKKKNTKT